MRSSVRGKTTSVAEVTNIDAHGFWLLVRGKEYFLPYEEYPWFRDARVRDILNVTLGLADHLHWPDLDVDLCVEALEHPESFPLTDRSPATASRRKTKQHAP
jgi:hypothetical protein